MIPKDATHYCGKGEYIYFKYDLNKGMWMYFEGIKWIFASMRKPTWIKELDDKTRSSTT